MAYDVCLHEKADQMATIKANHPHRRHAIDEQLPEEVHAQEALRLKLMNQVGTRDQPVEDLCTSAQGARSRLCG